MAKREMTPELMAQYKGLLPCSADARSTFTPDCFKVLPKDLQPAFTVRPMTRMEKTEYFTTDDADRTRQIVCDCITEVRNLRYADTGEMIDTMTIDIYASLHYDAVNAIREEIKKISSLVEVEKLGLK